MRELELAVTAGEVLVRTAASEAVQDGEILARIGLRRPHTLPILKWAGGKQWLARIIGALLPRKLKGKYYEPFLGGGSVFFSLHPEDAVLADTNASLMITYGAIASDVEALIKELDSYVAEKYFYDEIRKRQPRNSIKIAARMLYLNKMAWNGLYRVNRRGEFNVPFGSFVNPTICHRDRLLAAAKMLAGVKLRNSDFQDTVRYAKRGDLVYFDPPYTCAHGTNGFLKYNALLFSWRDQVRLAKVARRLKERGVHVIVSNAGHTEIVKLYEGSGLQLYRVERNSLIGGDLECRKRVKEVLFSSLPFELERPS
jgi:DNA adenine methylase